MGQGATPVELDRCAMARMRAEKRGGGAFCVVRVFAVSVAATVRTGLCKEAQGCMRIRQNVAGLRQVFEGSRFHFAACAQGDLWQTTGCGWVYFERGWMTVALGTECEG